MSVVPSGLTGSATTYRSAILSSAPLAYWPLETSSQDFVGIGGYDGVVEGTAPTYGVNGPWGSAGATTFNTSAVSETWLRVPGMPINASSGLGPFSCEAWVRSTSSTAAYQYVVGSTFTKSFYFGLTNGRCSLRYSNGMVTPPAGANDLRDGLWHHIAATVSSAGTVTLYQNGEVVGAISTGSAGGLVTGYSWAALGAVCDGTSGVYTPGNDFVGDLCHLCIYNRAIPLSEIQLHLAAATAPIPTNVVLAQSAPFSDTVKDHLSETYQNQLMCEGTTGPVTWTTVQEAAFLVSPEGRVGTQGFLAGGTYTANGVMEDAVGNTGIWAFVLTVVADPATPQAMVSPTQALPPTGIEMFVPFQVDPATGGIALIDSYYAILEQHVLTILLTSQGERVMLHNYGAGLEQEVFQPITSLTAATIQANIQSALRMYETNITLISVSVEPDQVYPYVLNVQVTFTATNFPGVQQLTLSIGGNYPPVITRQIGPLSP